MTYLREVDRYEAQILRYITEPFVRDTEIAGPIRLHLKMACSAIDTYIMVRLSDVAPGGRARKLSFGWLQASHRKIDKEKTTATEIVHDHSSPLPVAPGEPFVLDISLFPTANLFRAGHQMVLEIGSRPDLLAGSFSEGFCFLHWEPTLYPANRSAPGIGLEPTTHGFGRF